MFLLFRESLTRSRKLRGNPILSNSESRSLVLVDTELNNGSLALQTIFCIMNGDRCQHPRQEAQNLALEISIFIILEDSGAQLPDCGGKFAETVPKIEDSTIAKFLSS